MTVSVIAAVVRRIIVIFWHRAVIQIPIHEEKIVANRMGINTSMGLMAPSSARYMKMVTGNNVTEEVFKTKNMIWALVAVSGFGFRRCKSVMALMPSGVAALSSPNILAARLRVTVPSAGSEAGTSGIRRLNTGAKHLARP